MAYYNPFAPAPNGYEPAMPQQRLAQMQQQMYPQYFPPPVQPVQPSVPPPSASGIQWVQGKEGAKSYQVQPGGSVILMDSERPIFYIKSANGAGMPELHSYSFQEIHEGEAQAAVPPDYVPKSEFEKLRAEFEEFQTQTAAALKAGKKSSLILKEEHA